MYTHPLHPVSAGVTAELREKSLMSLVRSRRTAGQADKPQELLCDLPHVQQLRLGYCACLVHAILLPDLVSCLLLLLAIERYCSIPCSHCFACVTQAKTCRDHNFARGLWGQSIPAVAYTEDDGTQGWSVAAGSCTFSFHRTYRSR